MVCATFLKEVFLIAEKARNVVKPAFFLFAQILGERVVRLIVVKQLTGFPKQEIAKIRKSVVEIVSHRIATLIWEDWDIPVVHQVLFVLIRLHL